MNQDSPSTSDLPDRERKDFMVLEDSEQRKSLYHPTRKEILRALGKGLESFEKETKRDKRELDDGTLITEEVTIQRPYRRYWLNVQEILAIIEEDSPRLDISVYNCYYHLRKLQEQGLVEQYPPAKETEDGSSKRVRGMYFRTVAKFFVPTSFEISPRLTERDVLPDEISNKAVKLAQQVKTTGKPGTFDYPLEIDGDQYWFSVTMSLHDDGESIVSVVRDITEQKKAQKALRESQERLDLALRGADSAAWDMQFRPRKMVFSEAYAEIIGYSLEELRERDTDWEQLLHPEDLPIVRDRWYNHMKGKTEFYSSEHRLKHKNGMYVWVHERGRIVERGEDDSPLRAAGIVRDITAEKLVMEALDKSEERYRRLVEESLQGIAVLQKGRVVFANPAYAETTGRSIAELLRLEPDELWEIIHPEDSPELRMRVKKISSGAERLPSHRFRYIQPDGEVRWVESYVNAVVHDGEPALQILEVDITDQVRTERALLEREKLFRGVFESAAIGILLFDSSGKIIRFNEVAGKVLGVTSNDDFVGYSIFDDPNVPSWVFEDIQEGYPADFEVIYDVSKTTIRSQRTSTIYLKISGSIWRTPESENNGTFVVLLDDITERKQMESALLDSEQKYRTLVESIPLPLVILQGDPLSIVYVNDTGAQTIGYSKEELYQMGSRWLPTLFHPESLAMTPQILVDIAEKRLQPNEQGYEDKYVHKDGSLLWLVSHPALISYNGHPAIQVLLIDRTEERVLESALLESDEKYYELFDASDYPLLLVDGLKITRCNEAAADIFGCDDCSDIVGKGISDVSPDVQNNGLSSKIEIARVVESVRPALPQTRKWTFVECDGTKFDAEMNIKALKRGDELFYQYRIRKIE